MLRFKETLKNVIRPFSFYECLHVIPTVLLILKIM